ncbi:MAG: FAD:protein FMN transferase [Ruminococcaceae bacterium]|nr:FAD:protein FMN transferase [Oscillospiraceae bacterium]
MKNYIPRRFFSAALAVILLMSSVISLSGCGKKNEEYRDFNFFAMDTYITLRLAVKGSDGSVLSDDYLSSVANECADILSDIEGTLSAHSEKSDVYALNSGVDVMITADDTLVSLLETADKIRELTGGAYDYTLGAVTELWDPKTAVVPSKADVLAALEHTGSDKLMIINRTIRKLDSKTKIDFGGIGKGIAAQSLLEYLSTTDVEYGLVSLGGNIGVFGEKPEYGNYKIGIRDPDNAGGVIGYMYLNSGFISVSGDYERYFEVDGVRYHHIIDPVTGYPADSGVRSVAVHALNGASADALSTALFVLGVEKSLELYEEGNLKFEAVFVTDEGEIITTPGITEEMFEPVGKND